MRKLILFMSMSLDGFIGGADEDENNETQSSDAHRFANELFAAADTVLFGRTTYEGFTQYWDTLDLTNPAVPSDEVEFAQIFRRLNRVVFSRTLREVAEPTLLINDHITTRVDELKRQPGPDLLLVCGPELLATLTELGLVDELLLIISPKAWGSGQSLFGQLRQPLLLTLLSTRTFESGGVLHQYRINHR